MSTSKVSVTPETSYQMTVMERKVITITAKDLDQASLKARKYMMQRGGMSKCTLLSIYPDQSS